MRRTVALILAGLGTFLIVLTIVLPVYVGPSVTRFPLDEYETATLTASGATYFSPSKLSVLTDANLTAKYTVRDDGVGDSSRATWQLFEDLYDTTNQLDVQQIFRQFSFDRKTTAIINCCGSSVTGTGNIGYVFPFNTQKTTYTVFDTTVNKPEPYVYSGEDTIDGIATYKFTESVSPTKIGFLPLSATDPEYATEHNTFWIDPTTGALLNVDQDTHRYLADPTTGAVTQELYNADLKFTPATIQYVVGLDNNGRGFLQLIEIVLPLLFGFLGVVALIAGFVLYRLDRAQQGLTTLTPAGGGLLPDANGQVLSAQTPAAERPPSPRHAAPSESDNSEAGKPEATNVSMIPGMDPKPDEPGSGS